MPDHIGTEAQRARRLWRNHELIQKYRELDKTTKDEAAKRADDRRVLHANDGARLERSNLTKLRDSFNKELVKEIRSLFEDHTERNLANYKLALDAQLRTLLREKLRRLEAQQAQVEESQK